MFDRIRNTILAVKNHNSIDDQRKAILQPLVVYIQDKVNNKKPVNLNFICTHNSRRSHLAQIWSQVVANYLDVPNVNCYSGGTEESALYFKVVETLENQGFQYYKITDGDNPIYAIKYDENRLPIIGFSKLYDVAFNPVSNFAAIMTCSQADGNCPFIAGSEKRITITYEDPKISDCTEEQNEVYKQRSIEIAIEMMYVFSQITKNEAEE